MTGYERAVWDVVAWCERRSIAPNERLLFGDWFARCVIALGLSLPLGAAYQLWVREGRP